MLDVILHDIRRAVSHIISQHHAECFHLVRLGPEEPIPRQFTGWASAYILKAKLWNVADPRSQSAGSRSSPRHRDGLELSGAQQPVYCIKFPESFSGESAQNTIPGSPLSSRSGDSLDSFRLHVTSFQQVSLKSLQLFFFA